ncbi:hypothetical protein PM082_024870 [Marasmius tenuissimus]|nr:hypothetical protein PM082_024870 [Marasmius tenuissimus]
MCLVMKDWPGGAKAETFLAGKEKLKDYSDDELLAMERWATKFYSEVHSGVQNLALQLSEFQI